MAGNVVNSSIAARFGHFFGGKERTPQTATCHIANRYMEIPYNAKGQAVLLAHVAFELYGRQRSSSCKCVGYVYSQVNMLDLDH